MEDSDSSDEIFEGFTVRQQRDYLVSAEVVEPYIQSLPQSTRKKRAISFSSDDLESEK
jgi:hypothetical protein